MLWPVFPSFVRPRPLALALGTSEERARARQAAGSPETLGHGCPVLLGMVAPFGLSRNRACRRFWLFGPLADLTWLLHRVAYPFAPRGFPGSGLAPCFDGLSSPPGFRLAWRKQG